MRKILITILVALPIIGSSQPDQYSAFDKARIITEADIEAINYYVNNNNKYNAETRNLPAGTAFNYFKGMGTTNHIRTSNPIVAFDFLYRKGLDVNGLVKFKAISPSTPNDTNIAPSTDDTKDIVVKLNQAPTMIEVNDVAGEKIEGTGRNFSTDLLAQLATVLLERGQKELTNSFFEEIAEKMQEKDIKIFLPSTHNMFDNRYQYSVPSLGPTWKGAFESDLNNLPENLIKFLETKLPGSQKNELEIVYAVYLAISEIESGLHPSDALNSLYLKLSKDNKLRTPLQIYGIINNELSTRQTGNINQNKVWASTAQIRDLGTQGQVILAGLIFNKLKENGYALPLKSDGKVKIAADDLSQMVANIALLINNLDNTQKLLSNDLSSDMDKITAFSQMTSSFLKAITTFNKLLVGLSGSDGINLAPLAKRLNDSEQILNSILDAKKAVQSKKYGKLLSITLNTISLFNQELKVKLSEHANELGEQFEALNVMELKPVIIFLKNTEYFISDEKEPGDLITEIMVQLDSVKDVQKASVLIQQFLKEIQGSSTVKIPEQFVRIVSFVTEITLAESDEQIKSILEANILPVGSFRMKRQNPQNSLFVQGFTGVNFGYEFNNASQVSDEFDGTFTGLFLPIGLEYSWNTEKPNYDGIFLSIIDLGAIGTFNLKKSDELELPELTIGNVLAPGLYWTHGIKNAPITYGLGARFAPQLRQITIDDAMATNANLDNKKLNSIQAHLFIAVDIPLLRIHRKLK